MEKIPLEQFQYPIDKKTVERGNVDTHSIELHDRSLSWFGIGTSIKSDGVKLC